MGLLEFLPWGYAQKHPLIIENNEFFRNFDQSKPISSYEFVVFDTELTGLNARKDEIVSIGAVRIRNLRIVVGENLHLFVRPKRPLPKDSTLIHKITPGQLQDAAELHEILPDFVEFARGALLVGHYVGLDIGFINRAAQKYMGGRLMNPCIDTMRLAKVYKEEQWGNYYDRFDYKISYNLADLTEEYNLPVFDRHDALEDAMQTAYLFLFLVKKLKKGGLATLKDLYLAGRSWRWIF